MNTTNLNIEYPDSINCKDFLQQSADYLHTFILGKNSGLTVNLIIKGTKEEIVDGQRLLKDYWGSTIVKCISDTCFEVYIENLDDIDVMLELFAEAFVQVFSIKEGLNMDAHDSTTKTIIAYQECISKNFKTYLKCKDAY